ncbi:MAG: hypothetical protein IH936_15465 [Acidobacteria bacterium]|nr:hypothetical protein [Acidobacteriota bacterium]
MTRSNSWLVGRLGEGGLNEDPGHEAEGAGRARRLGWEFEASSDRLGGSEADDEGGNLHLDATERTQQRIDLLPPSPTAKVVAMLRAGRLRG